jgi:hypothetical protein
LEVYWKGGQGPPRAVVPQKNNNNNNMLLLHITLVLYKLRLLYRGDYTVEFGTYMLSFSRTLLSLSSERRLQCPSSPEADGSGFHQKICTYTPTLHAVLIYYVE